MPKNKRPIETTRTSSRRQASKEALKQMQLLLDDEEEDAFVIPDDDDDKDVRLEVPKKRTVSPIIEPPPKKKYKLSHRKSSDGNDRDVIVLKSISNSNYVPKENTLELECFVEELSEVQKERQKKIEAEEKELQAKLDELLKGKNAEVVHKGQFSTAVEVNELISNCGKKSIFRPNQIPQIGAVEESAPTYQLLMDPRLGIIIGTVQKSTPNPPPPQVQIPPPLVSKSKLQISSAVKAVANLPQGLSPPATRNMRTRRGAASTPTTPVQTRANNIIPTRANNAIPTRAANAIPTRASNAIPTRATNAMPTRATNATPVKNSNTTPVKSSNVTPVKSSNVTPVKSSNATPVRGNNATPTRGNTVAPTRSSTQVASPTPAIQTRAMKTTPTVQTRNSKNAVPAAKRPVANVPAEKPKQVVDLTSEENRNQVDNREISFNKLQGKTYPSLVVVARPHLRVSDLGADRSKLDLKVKSVLMHPPTKFTEWLIQQGLIRAEQKCPVHTLMQLKLGMYSDVSKFPFSGGYVWISECCPQRFLSVFNGSIFEGSPHPPMVMLKLIYHWSCQTNIQNVTQWVKVDNLYVKGVYTWLRGLCTLAVQTRIRQLGGPGSKIEVGVISLGTTSHDGNQRQVKVEVLGILESSSKFMRLRAVEPMPDGDRNFRKKFSKILEPILQWVHPSSTIVTDLTVDKATLNHMGFLNVIQTTSNDYNNSNRTIMEYLRRIVPRMFQNTLSLLSRQIIQQFLDELVWREWFGITAQQAFDNILAHLAEQTRTNTHPSLVLKLNKVAANPFRSWSVGSGGNQGTASSPVPAVTNQPASNPPATPAKTSVAEVKRYGRGRKSNSPQVQNVQERPTKPVSPDVPEQMVPLENYYYGTIESFDPASPKVILSLKCPFCKLVFDNNLQLQNHLFKHAHNVSNDAYLCRYCLTSVSTANELLGHVNKCHAAETKFDNGFVCLICETHYMNPFVLGKHMSKEHCPHELPYECGSCGFRCSNHKQVIDHFYVRHDGGTTIQCPFCLKSTTVWSGGRNIAQNMHYFIQHLQKHQKKQLAKRCGKCNLWFVQKEVLKDHQQKMHVSLRGRLGLVPYSSPRNGVMVPKSKIDKNPCDAEIINFSSLYYNIPSRSICKECDQVISSPKHFPSFDSCQNPNCQYSTCCATAMMTHNAKCKGLNSVIPPETLPFKMFCVCGHSDDDGNSMAKHLAICEKKSSYPSETEAKSATVMHSMLDILGLVRKPEEVAPKSVVKEVHSDKEEVKVKDAENVSNVNVNMSSNEISILSDDEDMTVEKVNAVEGIDDEKECDDKKCDMNNEESDVAIGKISNETSSTVVLDRLDVCNDEKINIDDIGERDCTNKNNEKSSNASNVKGNEVTAEKTKDEVKSKVGEDEAKINAEDNAEKSNVNDESGTLEVDTKEKSIVLDDEEKTEVDDKNIAEVENERASEVGKEKDLSEKDGTVVNVENVGQLDKTENIEEDSSLEQVRIGVYTSVTEDTPDEDIDFHSKHKNGDTQTESKEVEETANLTDKPSESKNSDEDEHVNSEKELFDENTSKADEVEINETENNSKNEVSTELDEIKNTNENMFRNEKNEIQEETENTACASASIDIPELVGVEDSASISGTNNIDSETFHLSDEEQLCKNSANENLHEAALNDILSTTNSAISMDVDLESELKNIAEVSTPMEVD